ncbi:MAG: PDZ domain-containing protein, partial [Calditrichota bacterium]
MSTFFRNRNIIRWSAVSLGFILLILAVYNFYRYAKSPTDENIFENPPSRISIIRNFPVLFASTDQSQTAINNGDLLLEINGQKVNSLSQVHEILSGTSADNVVTFGIFDPWQNRKKVVSIPVSAIPDSFAVQLPHVVYVNQVTAGGASDQAGLQVGDLIYKINGKTFQNSREADQILQQAQLN